MISPISESKIHNKLVNITKQTDSDMQNILVDCTWAGRAALGVKRDKPLCIKISCKDITPCTRQMANPYIIYILYTFTTEVTRTGVELHQTETEHTARRC